MTEDSDIDSTIAGDEDDSQESKPSEPEVDYKAEYERLSSIHKKTVGALTEQKKLNRDLRSQRIDDSGEEERQPTTDKDIDSLISERLTAIERRRVEDEIDDIIDSMSSNEDERKAIKITYEKRMAPSGFSRRAIARDLEDARLLVNRTKYIADAEKRAKRSLAERQAIESVSGRVASRPEEQESDRMTRNDKQFLDRFRQSIPKRRFSPKI